MAVKQDGRITLHSLNYNGGGDSATVSLRLAVVREECAIGVGPIDATFKALVKVLERIGEPVGDLGIKDCQVKSVGVGSEASGEAVVVLGRPDEEEKYTGTGTDTDVNRAAALAVIDALNAARGHNSSASNEEVY